jgi:hypothetical protein
VRAKLQASDYEPGQLLVRFKPGTTLSSREAVHLAVEAKSVLKEFRHVVGLQLVEVDDAKLPSTLDAYSAHPDVLYAEPDYLIELAATPNDPDFPLLWGMENTGQVVEGVPGTPGADIRATGAWDFWTGDPDFKIAVIDTGVDYQHPDLAPNIWVNPGEIPDNGFDDDGNGYIDDVRGWDFSNEDADPMDRYSFGHGSHVAGIIGAAGNNGLGVAGVNWQCSIVPLKIFGGIHTPISAAVPALEYCIDNDIRVSNNSWYATGFSQSLYDVVEATQAAGHIVVASAGNSAYNNDLGGNRYPACFDLPNIISVAATNNNDELAWFSHWGPTMVDIGAPGLDVYSTVHHGEYGYKSGTSMASPHVTGVVGLIMSRWPGLGWQAVKTHVLNTARPVDSLIGRVLASGVVNAQNTGDCNGNGIGDEIDVASSASPDCTGNGIPDECEPDCNANGIADSCDLAFGGSVNCNDNSIPDECEPDCNGNGVADACDVIYGTSEDCGNELVPDECEPDCNGNGVADSCDLRSHGGSQDCNNNQIPDECDVAEGTSPDENANLIPDDCDTIVYVDASAPAGGDGTSWATAYNDLQDALPWGDIEIWVAAGTYTPTVAGGNRTDTFRMRDGQRIFGGFTGGETRWDERDPAANVTILSGDLIGDDGPDWTFMVENSHHVIRICVGVNYGIIDGFTITGGNANGTDPETLDHRGGGILINEDVRLTISNCIFTGNSADEGGAIFSHPQAHPPIEDCIFEGNRALISGGAIYFSSLGGGYWDSVLTNCVFSNNSAVEEGGAVMHDNRETVYDGCTFTGNTAEYGGAMYSYSSDTMMLDCTLEGNSATRGGAFYFTYSDPELTGCTLIDNSAGTWGGGLYGSTLCDPVLTDTVFMGNTSVGEGGGAYIAGGTLAVLGCSFYDNTARNGGGLHLDGNHATIGNCIFSGNTADYRGGGIQVDDVGIPTIANSVFVRNSVAFEGGGIHVAGPADDEESVRVDNCILWGNTATSATGDAEQISDLSGVLYVNYSCVQDWSGALGGTGNFGTNPLFVDADGLDDVIGTPDDDFHLNPASPCIDAGDNSALSKCARDSDGNVRFMDDLATPDTGSGGAPIVDMGAYEFIGITSDCNDNGVHDTCDIDLGIGDDCNKDLTLDDCQLTDNDCNNDLIPDDCQLEDGDCDGNEVPDECQPDEDCNGNEVQDICDVADGTSGDCNSNRIPDECDMASGGSSDENGNGVPDDCEVLKNRYISLVTADGAEPLAYRVDMISSAYFRGSVGTLGWVGEPDENNHSEVVDASVYREDWPTVVYVGDCEIVPAATFEIWATSDGAIFADPREIPTIHKPGARYYGDVVGFGTGDLPPLPGFTPPNRVVNVSDVQAFLLTLQGPTSPSVHTTWVDLHGLGDGSPPNFILNVADLQRILWGIDGQQYLDSPEHLDPADCP